MSRSKWSWEDVQVVSHPQEQDRVMLLCPGPDCDWWYVYPEEFSAGMGLLKEYAEAHIKKVHKRDSGGK